MKLVFCILATLAAVNCYGVKKEYYDYCNDMGDSTFCLDDEKEQMCRKEWWNQICLKTCAYTDKFSNCGADLDFYCSSYSWRKHCMQSCYERDCKTEKVQEEINEEEEEKNE